MNNVPVPIPNHWSPHQALAVLDFLEALHQAVWEAYQEPLLDIIVNHTTDDPPDDTTLDHDFTDNIPF
ncbi:MAG: hypothetical protein ACREJK_08925 [Candidatus Methylomirabilales bacterium]